MSFEFDVNEGADLEADSKVKKGQYHLGIQDVDARTVINDKPVSGFALVLEVFNGTTQDATGRCTETGKTFTQRIRPPSPEHKDGGTFAKRIMSRLLVATGIAKPGQKVKFEAEDLKGRQFIAIVKRSDNDYPEIDGAHFYAIGDPAMSHVPLDREAIELLGGSAESNGHAATSQPALVGAAKEDDL